MCGTQRQWQHSLLFFTRVSKFTLERLHCKSLWKVRVTLGCNTTLIYHTYEMKPEKPKRREHFLQVNLKDAWVPDPQTPYLSWSLQKLWHCAPWKGRRGDPRGLWDWEIEEESLWGRWWKVQKGKKNMGKENERKKRDLYTTVWLQANWVLFVMLSRWGLTLATQWQPRTSTTTGEWVERRWHRQKKIKAGSWSGQRDGGIEREVWGHWIRGQLQDCPQLSHTLISSSCHAVMCHENFPFYEDMFCSRTVYTLISSFTSSGNTLWELFFAFVFLALHIFQWFRRWGLH